MFSDSEEVIRFKVNLKTLRTMKVLGVLLLS